VVILDSSSWLQRAPRELAVPFKYAAEIVERLQCASELAQAILHPREWGTYAKYDRGSKLKYLSRFLAALRDAVVPGMQHFQAVREEFAAVTGIVARWPEDETYCGASFHQVVYEWTWDRVAEVIGREWHTITESEVFERIAMTPERQTRNALDEFQAFELPEMLRRQRILEQELCRAWKRKYPKASDYYERMSAEEVGSFVSGKPSESPTRRYRDRSEWWRRWQNQGMSHSDIVDTWNALGPESRPNGWKPVAGSRDQQRDVVKKALRKYRNGPDANGNT